MRPTVGVVIAVRDGAAMLKGALDSVVEQLLPHDRVIVIVGESTDGTAEVARGLRCSRVPVDIVDQSGRGLAQARNQALALIEQELVAFCDVDDRWTAGSLHARLNAIRLADHVSAVTGAVRTVSVEGLDVPAHRRPQFGSVSPGYTPGALLAQRQLFHEVGGFDEQLAIACDSDWFLRLHESRRRLVVLDEVVLEKGVRPGSLSTDADRYRSELLTAAWRHSRRRSAAGSSDRHPHA